MPQSHAKSDTWYSLASLRLLYSRLPLLGRSRIGSTRPSQKSGGISTLADNGCGFHSHKVYLLALIRLMSGFDRRSRVTTITDFAVVLTSRRTSVRARAGFVSVAALLHTAFPLCCSTTLSPDWENDLVSKGQPDRLAPGATSSLVSKSGCGLGGPSRQLSERAQRRYEKLDSIATAFPAIWVACKVSVKI
jgi:hypothetical protein